ncbi:MAG: RimK family alpha-L-glutamate ligase [bacterium]|nr:RimK family alpha-L-glutamate ligase [bacterium]
MRAAVISEGSVSSLWTIEALKKYFTHVDDLRIKNIDIMVDGKTLEVLYSNKPMGDYDCIYAKGSFRYASVLRSLATALHKESYMPVKPATFTLGHDKLLTHLAMQQRNIPMPRTYLSLYSESLKALLKKVHYPVVFKFPQGTQGKGVMFADSFGSASSMLDALMSLKQPFILQEFIETDGVDIRAIVVGDRVVAAMKRKAVAGEQRANIHAGGKGEPFELTPEMEKVAVDTANVMGADICAVDILEGIKGPFVLEVNLSPGLQGITKATKIDVAAKIAKYLYDQTKEFKKSRTETSTEKIMTDLGIQRRSNEIFSTLDIRSGKIILPDIVNKITRFDSKEDVIIEASEKKLAIRKS